MKLNDVTAVTLFCCTPELVEPCLNSFRRFYPNMRLIIINNSNEIGRPEGPLCTKALEEYCRFHKDINLYTMPINLGHGLGLHNGIMLADTKYVYIFESDTIHFRKGLIENMLRMIKGEFYGIGVILHCLYTSFAECSLDDPNLKGHEIAPMLWLYSSLISRETYMKFPPFDSDEGINASPLKSQARAVHDSGRASELYINFDVDKYVRHLWGITRKTIGIPKTKDHYKWEKYLYSKST